MADKEQNIDGKFYESKTFIHASCEIIVVLIIVYYFYKKNNDVNNKIEELAKHVIEQNKVISDLQNRLNIVINNMGQFVQSQNLPKMRPRKSFKKQEQPEEKKETPAPVKVIEHSDSDTSSDSELDEEIQEELNNLN